MLLKIWKTYCSNVRLARVLGNIFVNYSKGIPLAYYRPISIGINLEPVCIDHINLNILLFIHLKSY